MWSRRGAAALRNPCSNSQFGNDGAEHRPVDSDQQHGHDTQNYLVDAEIGERDNLDGQRDSDRPSPLFT